MAYSVDDALKAFADYESAWQDQWTHMREAARFRGGDQWPQALRDKRESDGRPCLQLDRVGQYIRQIENDARQRKPSIKIRPVGLESDKDVADLLTGLVRHIEDASRAEIAYATALTHAAGEGLGWFRVVPHMIDEDANEQEPRILRIANPFSVVSDADWIEPDGEDIRDVFVVADMTTKAFKTAYPDADEASWEVSRDYPDWGCATTVRVAERLTKDESKTNILLLADGTEMPEADYWEARKVRPLAPVVGNKTRKQTQIKWCKLTRVEILEESIFPAETIPVIPVVGNEHWIDGRRVLSGATQSMMDPQRMYNYGASAIVEYIALQPKAPFVGAAGQFSGHEDAWSRVNTDNVPYLEYEPQVDGQTFPAPSRQPPPFGNSGWMSALQMFDDALQAASGMYKASLGAPSNETSGRAILARQKEGDVSTLHYHDNLGLSVRRGGRVLIDMIPRLYDTRRIVRILGEDGDTEQAVMVPDLQQPSRQLQMPDGSVRKLFNPGMGKYDVTVGSGPSYSTRRQEASEAMIEMASRNPALWQTHGDLIARSMDWPMAEDFAERSKALLPPQLRPAEDQANPEVAAIRAQAQQMMQQAQQAMQALQAENAQLKAQADQKQTELQLKAEEIKVKAFEAETDRLQAVPPITPEQVQALVMQTMQQILTPTQIG